MANDKREPAPQDLGRFDDYEDYEVRGWFKNFGITPETLKAAMQVAGERADAEVSSRRERAERR